MKLMRIYNDGTKVEIYQERLAISVCDSLCGEKFDIIGFESIDDINLFLNVGDFTEGNENEFYTIAGKKTQLIWQWKDYIN